MRPSLPAATSRNVWRDLDWNRPMLSLSPSARIVADVRASLDAGADPSAVGDAGIAAITLAAMHGHGEACRLLVAAGANVDHDGEQTPLYMAAIEGHRATCAVLLELGAGIGRDDGIEGSMDDKDLRRQHARGVKTILVAGGTRGPVIAWAWSTHGSPDVPCPPIAAADHAWATDVATRRMDAPWSMRLLAAVGRDA